MYKENADKVIEALKLIKEMKLIPLITLQALADEILFPPETKSEINKGPSTTSKFYSKNDKYHNLYGPAYIRYRNDSWLIEEQAYYVMGKLYSEEDFIKYFGFLSKD